MNRKEWDKYFSTVAVTRQGEIPAHVTDHMLRALDYADVNIYTAVPEVEPATRACTITVLNVKSSISFAMATCLLVGVSLPDEEHVLGSSTVTELLGLALIANDHTMTIGQIHDMIERTQRGENTGLHGGDRRNFCFAESETDSDRVMAICVDCDVNSNEWSAGYRVFHSGGGLSAGDRLLVSNLR